MEYPVKEFWYSVPVNPIPWTAPQVAVGRKGGKVFPMVYSSEELKAYKSAIKDYLERTYPDAPIIEDEVGLEFFFWRRLDDIGQGKKKHRSHVADATNLQKSTEDALQGVLFKNDKQVVIVSSVMMDQGEDVRPLIVIRLRWHPTRPQLSLLPGHVHEYLAYGEPDEKDDNVHDIPKEIF